MTWTDIKVNIYFEDGSLRDIYIRNVTTEDWKRWVDFVNANYKIDFEIGNNPVKDYIDFDAIMYYWNTPNSECPAAAIHVGKTVVKTYFLQETEIENDIYPTEVQSLADHETLVNYLQRVSRLFGKAVELTAQNPSGFDETFMVVNGDKVTFPIKHKV